MSRIYNEETRFWRDCLRHDPSEERLRLEKEIAGSEGNVQCLERGMLMMGGFMAIAAAGIGYTTMLEDYDAANFRVLFECFAAVGFAGLISFVTFTVLWFSYRAKIQDRREACHRLITRLVEHQVSAALPGVATVSVVQPEPSAASAPASVVTLAAKA